MQIGPQDRTRHRFAQMHHMMMIVPVNANIDKAQDIAEEDGGQFKYGTYSMFPFDMAGQNPPDD